MESFVYQNGKWHMPKWKVAYTRVAYPRFICENSVKYIYVFLYNWYYMIDIDAGPCSKGRAQIQAFPAKCLDESFAFQYVNLVPQGWASSLVYWTLQWAYHTSHRAPLHTRDHAGAAMFMRSTPDCGTLAGPSLEWLAFLSPRPNGFAESLSLKRPGALGRPEICPEAASWWGRVQLKIYDMHISDIYLSIMSAQ